MGLESVVSREHLKKAAKVVVPLTVGLATAYGLNETGITEWMAEKEHWNQTMSFEWAKDQLVPVGKWIYNSTGGVLASVGTYAGIEKAFK